MLALALRLGMTLQDLRERMSAEELLLWMAYHRESPISDMRGDVQASMIAAAAFQAQGVKVTALELFPQWNALADRTDAHRHLDEDVEGEKLLRSYLRVAAEQAGKCSPPPA